MTQFSRKKIRGFERKRKQVDEWKNKILSYPFKNHKEAAPRIFRIQLSPFYWFGENNFNLKFHKYLYQTYFEILKILKSDREIIGKQMAVGLWLFYPNTIRSIIVVSPHDRRTKLMAEIEAIDTNALPPRIIDENFPNTKWKIGKEQVLVETTSNDLTSYQKHTVGNIWIVE